MTNENDTLNYWTPNTFVDCKCESCKNLRKQYEAWAQEIEGEDKLKQKVKDKQQIEVFEKRNENYTCKGCEGVFALPVHTKTS